ncbi:hypothetical protein HYQ45_009623 [Verticillium longisporum]|uniref:Uncharacterized protein n=1 Tax=Verticillium longisporum TaxID=100787 RepID=A0A8I2ZJT9_VERLO|nr:hypothetical protein HYQ45_009623 [Verticillium longisporum]
MSEKDASSVLFTSTRRPSRASTPASRRERTSHETAESSTAAGGSSSSMTAPTTETTLAIASPDEVAGHPIPRQHAVENANGSATKEAKGYRTHKIRSSGGFLLQETLRDAASHDGSQSHHRRQSRLTPQSHRTRGSPRPSEKSGSSAGYDASLPCNAESPSRGAAFPPQHDASHGLTVRKRHVPNGKAVEPVSPPRAQNQGFEMDSAQIVNMALNLSESRRLASRRNASNAVPPTLAPLPDSATGGSLRQHLNQQRRTSRNISPRPGRAASPRLPPGSRINTPLQASFDLGREGSYRYQFSPSTLARAQKAKEHLELMAQYRRMLELVPPLNPNARRPTTASPPSSPAELSRTSTLTSADGSARFGRPYNPLQYIRNRKVRARERKAIDGEAQGFSDVKKVTDWVDNVARWAATGQSILPDGPSLPPFADADMHAQATSPSANAVKPKRPKVDWLFEPADLIADAYWLEQDNHLQLIEDRHWRRIFPPSSNLFRPLTGQTDMSRPESLMTTHTRGSLEIPLNQRTGNPRPIKTDSEHSHSSARERARQKLHELKGLHHRHGSHSHSDIRRLTKAPHSDLSDSEEEGKERRMPQRTFTGNSRDILEKQMLEMIAREARENGSDTQSVDAAIAALLTPERGPPSSSQPATREQSRKQSLAEGSESDDTPCKTQAQAATLRQRVGRSSLEIPMPARRTSFDLDASLPNSPDNHPHGYSPFIPTIGSDLSALPSRAGSPTRNPFHKVKSIFRERSKERGSDPSETRDGDLGPPIDLKGIMTESPQPISETPERRGSRSPPRNLLPRQPTDTYRAGPKRRSDESGAKGLFKGARLDTLIREGASKLGDFIWRKDSEQDDGNQSDGEATATDESDAEPARGRRRANLSLSRTTSLSMRDRREAQLQKGKHYLDVMPTFQHASHDRLAPSQLEPPSLQSSRPPSRSSRFDLLKPPRIDVHHASPSTSPPATGQRGDLEDSESQPQRGSTSHEDVHKAGRRLSSVISMPQSFNRDRLGSLATTFDGRHWSISDRSPSPQRAPLSRHEVARLRALVLSSGIKAMEISRRAYEPRPAFAAPPVAHSEDVDPKQKPSFWPAIAQFSTNPAQLRARSVAQVELYQLAARTLSSSMQCAGLEWQHAADAFTSETTPTLQANIEDVRRHIAVDLSAMTRAAADEADETSRDLAFGQRLKIKAVVDVIDKMLRRRRRRFRWVRRALWLGVEWGLVGIMWYVWFVVMILRVFVGFGKGVVGGVRWLLWL